MRVRGDLLLGVAAAIASSACGRSELDGGDPSPADAAVAPLAVCAEDGGSCVGRQCQAAIDACACHEKPPTTISGVVYDPAGRLPLYGVYVYIPTTQPDPIEPGHPTCTPCQAPVSGTPIVGTYTDAAGRFTLQQAVGDAWGVPSGDAVPIVLQIGKWRRQITIPHIDACAANEVTDFSDPTLKLRLPGKSSEGDMPRIAFTSGCDPAECFLRGIGIDDSEFVTPDSTTGHVHFFTGYSETGNSGNSGSAVAGGGTPDDTYTWWSQVDNLLDYDVIFNSCECEAIPRGDGAYQAIHDYLYSGGRLFADHFYHNWFEPPSAVADLQGVGDWITPENDSLEAPYARFFVDSSLPGGKAYADWLQNVGASVSYGELQLTDTRYAEHETPPASTRWIYNADTPSDATYASLFSTFTTPLESPADARCGRAAISEMHIVTTSDASDFPLECLETDTVESFTTKERAMEFMFFQLMSCVQDDTAPLATPTIK